MTLRSRTDGTIAKAELVRIRNARRGRDLVLLLHERDRPGRKIGRVVASIGYEIVSAAPEDLIALQLAGFQIPLSIHGSAYLRCLNAVLREMDPVTGHRRSGTPNRKLFAVDRGAVHPSATERKRMKTASRYRHGNFTN